MPSLDDHAFGEFYRQNARPLWTYVYRVTGNAPDADDIVQEAFIRVFNADLALRGDELRRYLFRVGSNLVADRWRRSSREQARVQNLRERAAAAASPTPDADVSRIFSELKPRERALLWLAYVEGDDHEEIAQSLGVARGSVKVLLSRARARLRTLLVSRGVGVKV